jgi:hypothetical protein
LNTNVVNPPSGWSYSSAATITEISAVTSATLINSTSMENAEK